MSDETFFTSGEAIKRLNISKKTRSAHVASGALHPCKPGNWQEAPAPEVKHSPVPSQWAQISSTNMPPHRQRRLRRSISDNQ